MNNQQGNIITLWKASLVAVLLLLVLPSCHKEDRDHQGLIFWSSNNTEEINFTKKYVDAWNLEHTDLPVAFQLVPEGQSSEEVILAAVVGRTTPDMYANMWQGDVEDFALSGVLIALDTLDGFLEFLYERCDSQVVKEITSSNGHIYQIPWKVNPIMMEYNPGLFKKENIDSIPKRYTDFLAAGATMKKSDIYLGISEVNAIWWQRFFNFLPLYYAASGGAPLVKDGKAAFNNAYGVMVFDFLQKIYIPEYFPKESLKGQRDPFLAQRVATTFTGPWTIDFNEKFKPAGLEYHYQEVPVPDDHVGPVYTYGDPKNIVIFNTCQHPENAWRFLKTLLSEKADLDFLEMSRQFPRRKNLLDNAAFASYFKVHPELLPFARQTAHLRGIDCEPNMKEVLDLISQEYEACVVYGLKSPEQGIKDAAHAVDLLYIK